MRAICRILTSTAVIGALISTATAATPTSAYANAIDWDAIAQCESGGDWSINTGNGYFGGSNSNRRHGPSMAVEAILPTQLEPSRSSSPSVSSARKD